MRLSLPAGLGALVLLVRSAPARAGMPSPFVLTDVGRMRLESLSFFLVVFLLAAGCVKLLWNYLRRDFPILPCLSYGKALGVVTLWGLLFILVLTMISGARELLTPGAWEPSGATYKLAKPPAPATPPPALSPTPAEDPHLTARRLRLEELRFALWEYARTHQGKFPPDRSAPEIPAERWQVPDSSRTRYAYQPPAGATRSDAPLVCEPDIFNGPRLVLLRSGEIRLLASEEIARLGERGQP